MNAANDELERSVAELLEQFTHDDLTPVARIYSCGFCEDGKPLMVMVDMVDGTDCFITLCPGEPIRRV